MAGRAIFLYYILCYSVGIMGLLSALFASASGWGRFGVRADLRFAFFTASFGLILIPMTVFVYVQSTGMAYDLRLLFISVLSIAGSSAFIVALPLFMGSFLDPPRRLKAMPAWIALACVSFSTILVLVAIAVKPGSLTSMWSIAFFLPAVGMLAAVLETLFSGKRAIHRLAADQAAIEGAGDEGSVERDDIVRWLRVLKSMRFMSIFLLLPMLVFDFFPIFFFSALGAEGQYFKVYPVFYAAMNAVYVVECFKLLSRRGRRVGIDASRADASRIGDGGATMRFLSEAASTEALSPREAEVAALLAAGATYKELCWKLKIKMGTARSHVSNVYRKLGVNCKEDLMRLARGEGRS
jgi:DNA-binding CsgD family transcriptional regulator